MKKLLIIIGSILAVCIIAITTVIGGAFTYAQYENYQIRENNILNQSATKISLDLNDYPELPVPVENYFNYAFNGQTSVTQSTVNWQETGDFMLPVGDFKTNAQQTSTTDKPVYLWEGVYNNPNIPLPMLDSRDGFMIDTHDMRAKLFGLMTVMSTDYADQADIDSLHSYLMLRYFGTAVDFPWMLLPSEYITWVAKDDTHAYLRITYKNYEGQYLVTFNDEHQITKMETESTMLHGSEDELREVGEKQNYQEVNGFMVPTHMEYFWYDQNDELHSKYIFDISEIQYN